MEQSIPGLALGWRLCARASSGWADEWAWTPNRGRGVASGSSCQPPPMFQTSPQFEFGALTQKPRGVLEHQLFNGINGVAALLHLQRSLGHGEWIADAPITGAVHPKPLISVHLDHVDGPCRRTLGFRIKCHARP